LKKIKAILVDDEERASNALSSLLALHCADVDVLQKCKDVPEAVLAINKLKPDLVFLDIEMPEYNGFELFGFFREIDFHVVFVTAYSDYAINAFEVSATDYLLKPVDPELLQAAVEKVRIKLQTDDVYQRLELLQQAFKGESLTKIALPMLDGLLFVPVTEIVYVEADGAYSTVFKSDGTKILVSKKLKFFENALENDKNFFRPHRSFVINLNHLKKYNRGSNEIVLLNDATVQISRERKSDFESRLKEVHHSI
jgi:two-component system LytT family response regulator